LLVSDLGPDLHVADYAAALLLTTLLSAQPEATHAQVDIAGDGAMSGDVGELNRSAQLYIGIRGWRAMRASRAVLAPGYEVESRALDRIILELVVHRRAILEDPSGEEARAWLKRRTRLAHLETCRGNDEGRLVQAHVARQSWRPGGG
jgi:hypothetical protein